VRQSKLELPNSAEFPPQSTQPPTQHVELLSLAASIAPTRLLCICRTACTFLRSLIEQQSISAQRKARACWLVGAGDSTESSRRRWQSQAYWPMGVSCRALIADRQSRDRNAELAFIEGGNDPANESGALVKFMLTCVWRYAGCSLRFSCSSSRSCSGSFVRHAFDVLRSVQQVHAQGEADGPRGVEGMGQTRRCSGTLLGMTHLLTHARFVFAVVL
jgi:hypothetical protein